MNIENLWSGKTRIWRKNKVNIYTRLWKEPVCSHSQLNSQTMAEHMDSLQVFGGLTGPSGQQMQQNLPSM